MSELTQITLNGTQYDIGDGISPSAKLEIVNCFENVAWANAQGTTYLNALKTAFGYVPVTGIELSSNAGNVYKGYTTTVTATVTPANAMDKTVVWTSSNESVATVSVSGDTATITGVNDGSAIITATTNDGGYQDTFIVTVATAVPTAITLNHGTVTGKTGTTTTLTATVTPEEAANKTLTWSSSDTSKVTVTPSSDTLSCTLSFVGVGTATITATSNVGSATATCSATGIDVTLTPITPTVKVCSASNKFEYAYLGDTKADVDTSDTSTIANHTVLGRGALVFDCTGMETIRVERYVVANTYGNISIKLYAFNQAPSYEWPYASSPSASETTDAAYKFIDTLPASQSVGDYITLGDYTVDSEYPFIVAINVIDLTTQSPVVAGASTDIAHFTVTTDTYATANKQTGVRISEVTA